MAYTVSQFRALDLSSMQCRPICAICGKSIQTRDSVEHRFIGSQRVHEDCYFEELGKIVEQCSIGSPIVRR